MLFILIWNFCYKCREIHLLVDNELTVTLLYCFFKTGYFIFWETALSSQWCISFHCYAGQTWIAYYWVLIVLWTFHIVNHKLLSLYLILISILGVYSSLILHSRGIKCGELCLYILQLSTFHSNLVIQPSWIRLEKIYISWYICLNLSFNLFIENKMIVIEHRF